MSSLAPAPAGRQLPALQRGWEALREATSDFERLRVRDEARAVAAAAEVLHRRDIQVLAAELIADAERAIAKANPPEQGKRLDLVIPDHEVQEELPVSSDNLRQMRRAHQMDDDEYEEIKAEHRDQGQPITRKALIERGKTAHVGQSTGHAEWYTPKEVIEAARKTMGGIDLDPASTAKANEIVKATRFLTVEDDALAEKTMWMPASGVWEGRVWLNPPYRNPDIDLFASRLLDELEFGTVTQAIWLSNNATETGWAQALLRYRVAICFPAKRIRFLDETLKATNSPLQGQMIIGFGDLLNVSNFRLHFGKIGDCR